MPLLHSIHEVNVLNVDENTFYVGMFRKSSQKIRRIHQNVSRSKKSSSKIMLNLK